MVEILIPHDSPVVGKRILELKLPREALVLLLGRRDEFLVPRGGTVLEAGDTMLVLADKQARAKVRSIVEPAHQKETDAA
jgi:cell volume regulation protein A